MDLLSRNNGQIFIDFYYFSIGYLGPTPIVEELHLEAGERRPALARLEEAQGLMAEHEEGWFSADLDCRHADALRDAGSIERAVALYQRGLQRARAYDGLRVELRLAIGLATLRRDQGDREAARTLLKPVLERLQQGFERPDALAARRLLGTLGGP